MLLRAEWRLGIVTNGPVGIQAAKVDTLGLEPLVDTVVFASSCGLGGGKPSPEAFVTAARRLGVILPRCVFVGDDPRCDIAGARRVGMKTIRIRQGVHGRAWVAELRGSGRRHHLTARRAATRGRVARRNGSAMCMMIADREVAANAPLFVIAEIGLNHGGDIDEALALVDAAAGAGASAVKLQSLRGETLVTAGCPGPAHVDSASLVDFFRRFELDEAAHAAVAARARARGLAFMSTPFEEAAVDMLERLGCDAYKIASGDVTHHRLIERPR